MFAYDRPYHEAALSTLRQMGITLVPIDLPDFPYEAITIGLNAEAAAAFDDLTRSGRDRLLTGQTIDDWPNQFRTARFIPAVDYINANRLRLRLMRAFAQIFDKVDVIVAPSWDRQVIATNFTGHPALIIPNGFHGEDAPRLRSYEDGGGPGTPVSITFIGNLFEEAKLCAIARAYQEKTGFHRRHPSLPPT